MITLSLMKSLCCFDSIPLLVCSSNIQHLKSIDQNKNVKPDLIKKLLKLYSYKGI